MRQLVFNYDGNPVRPGYHVTEVKAGMFSALDCGANPEAWAEIFVQLWDIDVDGRTPMPAASLPRSSAKSPTMCSSSRRQNSRSRLATESGDGPLLRILTQARRRHFEVSLAARPASCKPRDRWLTEEQAKSSCCGPASTSKCCA